MSLCWECREWLVKKFGEQYYKAPSNHCHYDDGPEEKPKPFCWCDKPTFRYVLAGEHSFKAEFCPVCSKKREEWGK